MHDAADAAAQTKATERAKLQAVRALCLPHAAFCGQFAARRRCKLFQSAMMRRSCCVIPLFSSRHKMIVLALTVKNVIVIVMMMMMVILMEAVTLSKWCCWR